jgi:hypothetical protein
MRGAQVRHDLLHARRLFRTQGGAEVGALRIVENDHLLPRKDTEISKNQARAVASPAGDVTAYCQCSRERERVEAPNGLFHSLTLAAT